MNSPFKVCFLFKSNPVVILLRPSDLHTDIICPRVDFQLPMTTSQMMSARALRISTPHTSACTYPPTYVLTSFRTPKLDSRSVPTRRSITNPYPTNSSSAHHPSSHGFAHTTQSPRLSPFSQPSSNHPPSNLRTKFNYGKTCCLHVLFCHRRLRASGQWKLTLRDSAPGRKALFTLGGIEAK
jgi:hypothetical protein